MKSIWSGRSALYEALVAAIKASAVSPQPDGTSKQDASLHGETLTVEPWPPDDAISIVNGKTWIQRQGR